jgi:hypothetical protein
MRTLLFALALVAGCRGPQSKEPALSSIRYDAWNEDIRVDGGRLVHTQTEYEFDRPTSATPSGSKTVRLVDAAVTREQMAELETIVRQSGFLDLADRYGAAEGQRHYPYRIEVTIAGRTKMVEFRSHPEAAPPPSAFSKVEKALQELSSSLRK